MKKVLTLLLTLCMIVSVCALPVSAADIALGSSNIEVVNAAQGILKVSGVLANDTPTENRYVTVVALPNGTPVTSYAGNTLALATASADYEGKFSVTFAFPHGSGTYHFYAMYEGQTFGPAVFEFKDSSTAVAVLRAIADGTTAKADIIPSIENHGQTGVDLTRFSGTFARTLFEYRIDSNRNEIIHNSTDDKLFETFYALVDKAANELAFVNEFNNTEDVSNYVVLMKANAVHMKNISFAAYDALGSEGKVYVQNSFVSNTYKNADEIKAAFDIAVADAPTSGVVPGPGPGPGPSGPSSPVIVPETNDREWSGEMEDNSGNSAVTGFTDIGSVSWAKEAIETLAAKGVIAGVSYGLFQPNGLVTREQFAKMIVLAANKYNAAATNEFTDIPQGDWSASYVASAKAAGFLGGVGEGKFGYGRSITREDMAVMIYNVMKANGTVFTEAKTDFNDYAAISDYAKEAVSALAAKGIINGMGDNMFAPKATATRAQAALLVYAITKGVA